MAEILVVEDYELLASLMTRALRRRGHAVVTAVNLADALSHADHEFDCAVLDMELPDGNGVTLAERLIERHATCRIVFFTGTRDEAMLARAAELGVVVDKLAGVEFLAQTIERFARRRIDAHEEVSSINLAELGAHGCVSSATSGQLQSPISA